MFVQVVGFDGNLIDILFIQRDIVKPESIHSRLMQQDVNGIGFFAATLARSPGKQEISIVIHYQFAVKVSPVVIFNQLARAVELLKILVE